MQKKARPVLFYCDCREEVPFRDFTDADLRFLLSGTEIHEGG